MTFRVDDPVWTGSWLTRRAQATPEAEAVEFAGRVLSYAELREETDSWVMKLRALGVEPGDRVAALLDNGLEWVRLLWAVQEIGATLLPLNLRFVSQELVHVLRDSRARFLLHGPDEQAVRAEEAAALCPGLIRCAVADDPWGEPVTTPTRPEENATPIEATSDLLAILYTSGTSGTPKGALLSADAFWASAVASAELLGTTAEDRWLVCMPLFHVGGLSILIRACVAGSCAVIHPRFDAEQVAEALEQKRISGVSFVATMLERVMAARGSSPSPPALRCVLLGGGPAPDALLERASAQGYPIAPTYGLTEAASQVATRVPGGFEGPPSGGLVPLPGTELRIVDEEGGSLEPGSVGEICVRGPTLMRGYEGLPEATQQALRGGWLHTGDAGVLDESGRLRVLERRDDLIISGGENIYPAEVESVLESHPLIREAGVVGEAHGDLGARPVAWCVADGNERPASSELEDFCRARLAGYKVPDRFTWLDELPRTASGKLLRRKLRG